MPVRPPSPSSAPTAPSVSPTVDDDRIVTTTTSLANAVEARLDTTVDVDALESLLYELERQDCVEWVTVTPDGASVWDLTDAADPIAEAVAAAVVDLLSAWIDDRFGRGE